MPVGPPDDLISKLTKGLAGARRFGLAVSGGGDSMAMLHLAHRAGLRPHVATVDHGLRAASADEARMVARICGDLGLPHVTLNWQGWDQRGNLQDAARRARRRLLADWAQTQALKVVALAHTRDDLAETLLMRLARGAGVDGLAAMRSHWYHGEVLFRCPLLGVGRDDLRDFLRSIGAEWVDDPSNDMDRFDRVRVRKALKLLQPLGIDPARLADVAAHMAQARDALDEATDQLASAVLTENAGIVSVGFAFRAAPPELQRRLIRRVILWITPADYAPRGAALAGVLARILAGQPAQLAGCHFRSHRGHVLAFREARFAAPATDAGAVWDGVWQWQGAVLPGAILGALGEEGLAQWPYWRESGLPRPALLTQPALWYQDRVIATPLRTKTRPGTGFFHRPGVEMLYNARFVH